MRNIPILSQRLKKCADMVRDGAKVADVGTDHGLIPIYLVNTEKCISAVASDINEGPLCAARKNISHFKADNYIRLNLGNGTSGIESSECDDIVIAGMGGETIAKIINTCSFAKDSTKRFILQPMSSISDLRQYLYENGYKIITEDIAVEDDRYYVVIVTSYSGMHHSKSGQLFYEIGELSKRLEEDNVKEYLRRLSKKYDLIANRIKNSSDSTEWQKYRELSDAIKCVVEGKEYEQG